MKILLVNDYGVPAAGAERITRHLRDGLRQRGHTVRVLASRAQLIAGESIADVSCFGTTSRWQTLTSTINPSAARTLQRELAEFRPDVVQVQMFLWQLSPSILPLLASLPSVYYAMTFKAVCPTGLKWLPSGAHCDVRAGRACLVNRCVTPSGFLPLMWQRKRLRARRHAFTAIVGCSHAVRDEFEADDVVVHDVIWPGTPVVPARPPLIDPPVVTFTGRLVPEKGVDVLLRAFQRVQGQLPAAQLHIAGSGLAHVSLVALMDELGLQDHVIMHGQLGDRALQALLGRSWVHAVPSRWAEPFGMTATEAMMQGTAVVASNVGGLADIVEHGVTGMKVPPGDASALAEALISILSDRTRAESMGTRARERALTHFALDPCVSRFEALYDQLRT